MFTGIVTAVGRIREAAGVDGGLDLTIACPYEDLLPGESVAVDGACVTVQRVVPGGFVSHLVRTTLDRTRFEDYGAGRAVNLERSLRARDRLGGHLVQGHVDGVGEIRRIARLEDALLLDIAVPAEVARVTVPLGSITVDGVSLTVNSMPDQATIQVSLIPFTLQHTTLGERKTGDRVHLEADTIGKYVRKLMMDGRWQSAEGGGRA